MTSYTANYSIPSPDGPDDVVVHSDIKDLADKVDEQLVNVREDQGFAGASTPVQNMAWGVRYVASGATATTLGLPAVSTGWLTARKNGSISRVNFETTDIGDGTQRNFSIATDASGSWAKSKWVQEAPGIKGVIGVSAGGGTWEGLPEGVYMIAEGATATALKLPSPRPGVLSIMDGRSGARVAEYQPNDPLSGTVRARWECRSRSDRSWGTWYYNKLLGMRSAPIVASLPSIDSTQSSPNEAWRSIFTTNYHSERARIHLRGRNFRTGVTHGPVNIVGMGVAQRDRAGLYTAGTLTNVPGGAGAVIPAGGGEWVSDWFDLFLSPGNEYMLMLGATFPNTPVALNNFWGYTTTAGASEWANNEEPRWGQVPFCPFEIWIEVQVPSDVPVIGYFGASTTMGMNLPDGVRYSYPQLHAKKHGGFAAQTAGGGWAVTDDTAWDLEAIDRFGAAGHCDDLYVAWGANELSARGKTAQEVFDRLVLWLDRIVPKLGNPRVHLITVRARPGVSGPTDPVEVERAKLNRMLRYTPPEITTDVIDMAAVFDDPLAPWRRRSDVVGAAGPSDTHPNKAGQGLWAQVLDGGGGLPAVNPVTVEQSAGRVVKVWDYLNNRDQMIYGDTGSRKISSAFPDRVSGESYIRRSGNVVTMDLDLMVLSGSGTYTHAGLVPYGFRPTGLAYGIAMHLNAAVDMHRYNISSAGNWSLYYYTTGKALRSTLSWITSDPWPTALPGVAA